MLLTNETVAEVLGDRTAVIEALERCENAARAVVDQELLDLCERRVGELLRATHSSDRPAATAMSDREQACLNFTEHWVIDVATMPAEVVAAVAKQIGDEGLRDFVHGLLVVEQRQRLALMWDRLGLGAA